MRPSGSPTSSGARLVRVKVKVRVRVRVGARVRVVVRAWDGCGGDTLAREVDGEGKDAPHQPGDNGDEQSVLGEPLAHDDVDDEDDPDRAW